MKNINIPINDDLIRDLKVRDQLTGRGLPAKPVGKVAVAIARSNPNCFNAHIETGDGVPWDGKETDAGQVFRSDDGGESWRVVSYDHLAMGRPHYYSRMAVAPDNENEAYFLTASFSKTIDGGLTLNAYQRDEAPGGDHHDIWIDPTNAKRQIVAHDRACPSPSIAARPGTGSG